MLFISTDLLAQVQKGDVNLGSNFGLMNQKGDEDILNYSATTFQVNLQYYVTDKVSLGGGPMMSRYNMLDDAFLIKDFAWNIGANYSFLSSSGKVMPYLGIKMIMMKTTIEIASANAAVDASTDVFGLGGLIPGGADASAADGTGAIYKRNFIAVSAGIKFFLTERINLDNNITYGSMTKEELELIGPFTSLFSGFGLPTSFETGASANYLQVTVGFGYIIGKRGT